MSKTSRPAITIAFIAGVVVGVLILRPHDTATHAASVTTSPAPDQIAALKADVDRLKSIVTDQSHVMSDVSYHYTNLWFAGQSENWPLAQFYSDETHSHLKWAVRVIPMRKDRSGRDVDLTGILTALEQTSLKDLDNAIKTKNKGAFGAAYAAQMKNCMACHQAASKEFIRLRIPDRSDASIIQFQPENPSR